MENNTDNIAVVPDSIINLIESKFLSRKRRIAVLIAWFQHNYYLWSIPYEYNDYILSHAQFAIRLTNALTKYDIVVQSQRIWTWVNERNLPRPDNFRIIVENADKKSWQWEFARLILEILKSEEPE